MAAPTRKRPLTCARRQIVGDIRVVDCVNKVSSHKETPPRLRLGGRSSAALEMLTSVSKDSPYKEAPPRIRKRPFAYAQRQVVADIRIGSCASDGQLLKKAFTNPNFLFIIKG